MLIEKKKENSTFSHLDNINLIIRDKNDHYNDTSIMIKKTHIKFIIIQINLKIIKKFISYIN